MSVLHELRKGRVSTPVLLLTVRANIEDKVLGLDAGADDYLTKPFAFQELVARIRALPQKENRGGTTIASVCRSHARPPRRVVLRGVKKIDLTAKEYALLYYFMRNSGLVLTRTMISDHVWDYNFDSMINIVDVYLNYLRRKIDSDREHKLIHTVRGVGYVLKEE